MDSHLVSSVSESTVASAISDALAGRRLLDHPFYRRWEEGKLAPFELAAYAEQYRHFERALPGILEDVASTLPPSSSARDLVLANLVDERSVPEAHAVMFEGFARAAGARTGVGPTEATTSLLRTYGDAVRSGGVSALGALAAYECQSSEIAASKADGLANRYGFDAEGTAFWDVHATMDAEHGAWTCSALAGVATGCDAEVIRDSVRSVADAWWSFLDEREAAAAAA